MKKILTISAVLLLFLLAAGLSMRPAPVVQAELGPGSLIKTDGLSTVYYLAVKSGTDYLSRYVFPDEATFFSWNSDYEEVITVTREELQLYPLASNCFVRPGTYLVKISTDSRVFAVESNGLLRHIPSAGIADHLYGENWIGRLVDLPDAFFTNYQIGAPVQANSYPEGSIIRMPEAETLYYIDSEQTARKFHDRASFQANGFSSDFIIVVSGDFILPPLGDDITDREAALADLSSVQQNLKTNK